MESWAIVGSRDDTLHLANRHDGRRWWWSVASGRRISGAQIEIANHPIRGSIRIHAVVDAPRASGKKRTVGTNDWSAKENLIAGAAVSERHCVENDFAASDQSAKRPPLKAFVRTRAPGQAAILQKIVGNGDVGCDFVNRRQARWIANQKQSV